MGGIARILAGHQFRLPAQWILHLQRCASTSRTPRFKNASEAAAYINDGFADTITIRKEELDRQQLRKLALTLNRPIPPLESPRSEVPPFTEVPPGWHLVYFTGGDREADLGADGSDRTFNAPAPLTRRVWAGGKMVFHQDHALRAGVPVEEHTRLVAATAKRSRESGQEMVLVEVEKKLYSQGNLSVVDSRSWMFRPSLVPGAVQQTRSSDGDVLAPSSCEEVNTGETAHPVWHISWSPVGLFRFSALTFNGHKIHYNEDWTRTQEGHPGVVVHGPLNLITLLDYWRSIHAQDQQQQHHHHFQDRGRMSGVLGEISYRALSPVYAGEKYSVRTAGVEGVYPNRVYEVVAERGGLIVMRASIVERALTGPSGKRR